MLTLEEQKKATFAAMEMHRVEDTISKAMLAGKKSVIFDLTNNVTMQDEDNLHPAGADLLSQAGYTVQLNSTTSYVVGGWFK